MKIKPKWIILLIVTRGNFQHKENKAMSHKKNVQHLVGLLILALLVPLAGCSESIVGVWENEEQPISGYSRPVREFSSDGTGSYRNRNGDVFSLTWKIDGNLLVLTFPPSSVRETRGEVYKYQYKISGSTLTDPEDKTSYMIYRKINQ